MGKIIFFLNKHKLTRSLLLFIAIWQSTDKHGGWPNHEMWRFEVSAWPQLYGSFLLCVKYLPYYFLIRWPVCITDILSQLIQWELPSEPSRWPGSGGQPRSPGGGGASFSPHWTGQAGWHDQQVGFYFLIDQMVSVFELKPHFLYFHAQTSLGCSSFAKGRIRSSSWSCYRSL